MQITNNLPDHYLEGSNPAFAGPVYTFPTNGEFAYDPTPAFDKSFRVKMRTAGPNSLVPAPQIKATSNLSVASFLSSPMTVLPGAYNKLVLVTPGETLRPGIDSEADGKTGAPSTRQAGVAFNATAFATDIYFNPVTNPPFPNINFALTPTLPGSFVNGTLPAQMVSGSRSFNITLQSNSDVKLFDVASAGTPQTVPVPVTSGLLHHFAMDVVSTPQQAGVPFTTTIKALDQFNNVVGQNITVTLAPNTGAGTMSPSSIDLVNGVFTGNLTMFTASTTVKSRCRTPAYRERRVIAILSRSRSRPVAIKNYCCFSPAKACPRALRPERPVHRLRPQRVLSFSLAFSLATCTTTPWILPAWWRCPAIIWRSLDPPPATS
jgi:hypothetical protein